MMRVLQPGVFRPPTWIPEQVSMLPIPRDQVASQECVGDNTKGPEPAPARPAAKVWFAIDMEAHAGPTTEPTKQDRRAPIKIVGGRAWSPGIYQALRLLGKSLDVAWEKAFIHPLTFN
jgi:hypothetical protein